MNINRMPCVCLFQALEHLQGDTLWSLDWQTVDSIPNQLGQWTHGSGTTKDDGEEEQLGQTVVVEENTG